MDWLVAFTWTLMAANAALFVVSVRLLRQIFKLRHMLMVLCTQAYAARGWPLHRILLRGVTMSTLREVEDDD